MNNGVPNSDGLDLSNVDHREAYRQRVERQFQLTSMAELRKSAVALTGQIKYNTAQYKRPALCRAIADQRMKQAGFL